MQAFFIFTKSLNSFIQWALQMLIFWSFPLKNLENAVKLMRIKAKQKICLQSEIALEKFTVFVKFSNISEIWEIFFKKFLLTKSRITTIDFQKPKKNQKTHFFKSACSPVAKVVSNHVFSFFFQLLTRLNLHDPS